MSEPTQRYGTLLSFALIDVTACILLVNTLILSLGGSVSGWSVPLGLLLAGLLLLWRVRHLPNRIQWFVLMGGCVSASWIGLTLLNILIVDVSWDGQAYHAEGIIQVAQGWNPIQQAAPSESVFATWLTFFTKGPWINAAAMLQFTGSIEAGKAVNAWMLLASFMLGLSALSTLPGLSRRMVILFSLLLALNPVTIYQLFSNYVDGLLASCLLMLLLLFVLLDHRVEWGTLLTLLLLSVIILNIKLSAALYWGVIVGGYLLWRWFTRRQGFVRLLATVFLSGLIGTGWVGFNPYISQYVTNQITHQNPFYPTTWDALINLQSNTPAGLAEADRFGKLFLSLFARSAEGLSAPQVKWPFTVNPAELDAFGITSPETGGFGVDVRVGGFGPWFSGALLLSLLIVLLSILKPIRDFRLLAWMSVILLATVAIPSDGWWARYVPQLGFVPVLVALLLLASQPGGWRRWLGYALMLTLALNIGMVSLSYISSIPYDQGRLREQFTRLALESQQSVRIVNFGYFPGVQWRFDQWGIQYQVMVDLPCGDAERENIVYSEAKICLP